MQAPVRFLTTADSVSIAYCTQGDGPPFVFVRGWISHIELAWDDPEFRAYFEPFIRHFRLVRYDMRGNGLSDHEFAALDLDGAVADLEAVMDDVSGPAILYGQCFGGPIAIAYTARHPERVSHLILDGTYARGGDVMTPKQRDDLIAMLRNEPEAASLALSFMTEPEPDKAVTLREHYRAVRRGSQRVLTVTATQLYTLGFTLDVSACLPAIVAPTLVLHRRENRAIPFRLGRELAAQIPNARFAALPGTAANPWNGDIRPGLSAIGEFLGVDLGVPSSQPARDTRAPVLTIMFTDMESSTATTQRLGDAAAQDLVRAHNTVVRDALRQHEGNEVKHTGDGIMASFAAASNAVDCAIAIQRGLAERTDTPRVRIGINAGEPVAEEHDLFGTAVQLAARVCAHAEPGQIVASNVVRELTAGKKFLFADIGTIELRGFEDSVRLYELRWQA